MQYTDDITHLGFGPPLRQMRARWTERVAVEEGKAGIAGRQAGTRQAGGSPIKNYTRSFNVRAVGQAQQPPSRQLFRVASTCAARPSYSYHKPVSHITRTMFPGSERRLQMGRLQHEHLMSLNRRRSLADPELSKSLTGMYASTRRRETREGSRPQEGREGRATENILHAL